MKLLDCLARVKNADTGTVGRQDIVVVVVGIVGLVVVVGGIRPRSWWSLVEGSSIVVGWIGMFGVCGRDYHGSKRIEGS